MKRLQWRILVGFREKTRETVSPKINRNGKLLLLLRLMGQEDDKLLFHLSESWNLREGGHLIEIIIDWQEANLEKILFSLSSYSLWSFASVSHWLNQIVNNWQGDPMKWAGIILPRHRAGQRKWTWIRVVEQERITTNSNVMKISNTVTLRLIILQHSSE